MENFLLGMSNASSWWCYMNRDVADNLQTGLLVPNLIQYKIISQISIFHLSSYLDILSIFFSPVYFLFINIARVFFDFVILVLKQSKKQNIKDKHIFENPLIMFFLNEIESNKPRKFMFVSLIKCTVFLIIITQNDV